MDMHLFDIEPMAREIFKRVGCLSSYQNMQRGHQEVEKQFSLNFDGKKNRVGDLKFEVIEPPSQPQQGSPFQVKIGSRPWY